MAGEEDLTGGSPPPLRIGEIDVSEITPIRINFNPASGRTIRPEGLPGNFGCAAIGPHQDASVVRSFERNGIQNPVFLWARFGRIWVRLGGSRVHFARTRGLPALQAMIADYDDRFPHWPELGLDEALAQFQEPDIGVTPDRFIVTGDRLDIEVVLWRDYLSSRSSTAS